MNIGATTNPSTIASLYWLAALAFNVFVTRITVANFLFLALDFAFKAFFARGKEKGNECGKKNSFFHWLVGLIVCKHNTNLVPL